MKTTIATLIALTAGLSVLQAQSATAPASGGQSAPTPRAKAPPPLAPRSADPSGQRGSESPVVDEEAPKRWSGV